MTVAHFKGGLFSESFLVWLKSPKIGANHYPKHYPPRTQNAKDCNLAPMFGDFSQIENVSEINPPIVWCVSVQKFLALNRKDSCSKS